MVTLTLKIRGAEVHKGLLSKAMQSDVLADVRRIVKVAPLFHPETARGRKMSVRMTSAGALGWVSDRKGYRYERCHPQGMPWPQIPASVLNVWTSLTALDRAPDSCLINFYSDGAKMGLHQDRDEASFEWPVVSLSLGDDALFRVGGLERSDPTESIWLNSGDVVVMGKNARLAFHGIDRIKFGTSDLLRQGGRLNLTLRVARG